MRIASWSWGGRDHVGTVSQDGREATPLALADASRGALPLIEGLARGESLPAPSGARVPVDAITLRAPLPRPLRGCSASAATTAPMRRSSRPRVFAASLPPKEDGWPIVFTKVARVRRRPARRWCACRRAAISTQIDYEAELAVVIGRGGRDIPRARAMDHVCGYTIVNDVTARDVQVRHQQWDLGKSFDTFCPMGPWIVDAPTSSTAATTRVRGWVNGELRPGRASTRDLIFDIPTLIETCSRGITLYPGDVIATGTPAGVGMGFEPPTLARAPATSCASRSTASASIENRFE